MSEGNPFLQKVDNPFLKPPTPNINIDDILTGKAPDRDPVMRARFANATGDAITDDMVGDIQDDLKRQLIEIQKKDIKQQEEYTKTLEYTIKMTDEIAALAEEVGATEKTKTKVKGNMDKLKKKTVKELSQHLEQIIDQKYELKRNILKRAREQELRRIRGEIGDNKGNLELQQRTVEQELARVKGELAEMAGQPS
tara:strand:+ start:1277 stop:1864 length:588 start_codon:yes stop_codon:yes gene_type:complete